MKYVDFFGTKVSKLIVGDNPYNGWSYITDWIPGAEMRNFYTEAQILSDMEKMEELGINTMLPLADPFMIRVLQHYRANGGKMNFIFQTYGGMLTSFDVSLRLMMEVNPIGIYLSGTAVDVRHETGRDNETKDFLAAIRKTGVRVGLGTHRPDVIRASEEEGWDIDFYMACMYNGRRNREGQESGFITGKSKSGLTFWPEDRPIMLETLKTVKKPIIAFKLFAGGQMLVGLDEAARRAKIRETYDTVFGTLKPDDFGVMGVFQKHHDQLTENVSVFNEWANA